eukprot:g4898.t1
MDFPSPIQPDTIDTIDKPRVLIAIPLMWKDLVAGGSKIETESKLEIYRSILGENSKKLVDFRFFIGGKPPENDTELHTALLDPERVAKSSPELSLLLSKPLTQDVEVGEVIALHKGKDDEYPPQRKAFLMWKFIADHFLTKYEWFMKADSDTYINLERLSKLLQRKQLNRIEVPHYCGRKAFGKPEERGKLGLRGHEYCMGGPGYFINSVTLRKLKHHIFQCMKETVTKHEDTEFGRCVYKHVHISCCRNAQTKELGNGSRSLFFNSFKVPQKWPNNELKNYFITAHPVKELNYVHYFRDNFS